MRRTLAQRRRASGLQISSNQNEATPITGDSTDTYIQEVVKNEQLQDQTKAQSKPGFVADAFRALEGKSSSTCNLPLEQLRKELEAAAYFSVLRWNRKIPRLADTESNERKHRPAQKMIYSLDLLAHDVGLEKSHTDCFAA